MKRTGLIVFLLVALVALTPASLPAQQGEQESVTIHENVTMVKMPLPAGAQDPLKSTYLEFLKLFEAALKEGTTAQSADCALTVRVSYAMKEIGKRKVNRAQAKVAAYRKNAKHEYQANLLLYNFVTAGPVTKEDVAAFLKHQILDPAKCLPTKAKS